MVASSSEKADEARLELYRRRRGLSNCEGDPSHDIGDRGPHADLD